MVSVVKLNDVLTNNASLIIELLEELGVANISFRNNSEIRFGHEENSNPSSCKIDIQTLNYTSFSKNEKGNIYTLTMSKRNLNFPNALKWIARTLEIDNVSGFRRTKLPFGGFYQKINKQQRECFNLNKTISEECLLQYQNKFNTMFFNDGISYDTQAKFNIGYDVSSNRVTIPEYDINGNLVGVMGRYNVKDCEKGKRWLPIKPCSRNQTLYGFHINYQSIIDKQICFVGESEKFVMQLDTMGLNCGLSTCTNSVSKYQANVIKNLRVPFIILCYDEGIDEKSLHNEVIKLKSNNIIYTNKVGYIFDKQNKILPAGSKCSPTDLGKKKFKELIRDYVTWIA